ncbi:MAG: hypothetical protein ACYTE8_03845 [Planctomycetota bacterium]|jgi:prepilin-type processing-associated H-X9-DG protein
MVFIDAGSRSEWIDGSFSAVEDIDEEPSEWFIKESRNITARHRKGTNISFADNHCEFLRYKDSRTIRLAEWTMNPADASEDNVDLEYIITLLRK